MKARHVIMISIIILFILILFGNRNIETIKCTVDGTLEGKTTKSTLEIKVKNDEVKDMNMEINMFLSSEEQNQKDYLINSINSQGKMTATSTKDGIKLTANMDSRYFDSIGLNKTSSVSELKEVLETQGFKCK